LKISVIIPTLGENDLNGILTSIVARSNECEVIVINTGIDERPHILDSLDRCGLPFQYKHTGCLSANKARNLGARMASGEILCFTDDDVELTRDYFIAVIETFEKYPSVSCAGGFVDLQFIHKPRWLEGPFLYMLSMCDWHRTMDVYYPNLPIFLQKEEKYLVGASMSIPKRFFPRVQWDENFGYTRDDGLFIINDEMNIISDLRKLGDIAYCPYVKANHVIPERRATIQYLKRRFYRQATSDIIKQTVNNPAMTAEQLYNTLVLHTASNLTYPNVINEARQKIANEEITRQFVVNYIACKQAYLQGLTDEIAKIYNT
jgi:glucosyl-dolichyl phosphate glucuronosyltransferase